MLTKALQRTAQSLGLTQRWLAEVLGVSEPTVSRLGKERLLNPDKKEFELAVLLVRLYRSLDALVGGSEDKAKLWFHANNRYLEGVPADLVKSVGGLLRVVEYLDAMRGQN